MGKNIRTQVLYKNISYLRNLKKLSQQDVADALDIGRSRLGSYEENRSEPSIEMLIALSEYFMISIDDLIKKDLRALDQNVYIVA